MLNRSPKADAVASAQQLPHDPCILLHPRKFVELTFPQKNEDGKSSIERYSWGRGETTFSLTNFLGIAPIGLFFLGLPGLCLIGIVHVS